MSGNCDQRHFTLEEVIRKMNTCKWPDGYQSAAVFTFDLDGSSEQQLYEGNILGNNSAGDYGPKVAIPRVLDLLDRYEVKATFFCAGWVGERYQIWRTMGIGLRIFLIGDDDSTQRLSLARYEWPFVNTWCSFRTKSCGRGPPAPYPTRKRQPSGQTRRWNHTSKSLEVRVGNRSIICQRSAPIDSAPYWLCGVVRVPEFARKCELSASKANEELDLRKDR